MKLQEIRTIARSYKLKPDGSSKSELIRKIQINEGNYDCYGTASLGICDQSDCLWSKDCLTGTRE